MDRGLVGRQEPLDLVAYTPVCFLTFLWVHT
jgi:hypothetical protein